MYWCHQLRHHKHCKTGDGRVCSKCSERFEHERRVLGAVCGSNLRTRERLCFLRLLHPIQQSQAALWCSPLPDTGSQCGTGMRRTAQGQPEDGALWGQPLWTWHRCPDQWGPCQTSLEQKSEWEEQSVSYIQIELSWEKEEEREDQ